MQYPLRHERRDQQMGRIWRITYKDRPLDKPPKIAGATVEELLENLKAYEDRTRYRTRRVLWKLPDDVLQPALRKWIADLDGSHPDFAHHLTEALWLHQQRGWISEELFGRVSTSPDPRARAAAARLLRYWFDELPHSRGHLLRLAADESPKVRLESVVSCTWIDPSVALEVIEIVGGLPQDPALKTAFGYAQRALKPMLKDHPMTISVADLAKRPLTAEVVRALVRRPGLDPALRRKALAYLAGKHDSSPSAELASIIAEIERRREASLDDWLDILDATPVSSPEEFAPLLKSSNPDVRRAGHAAMLRSGSAAVVIEPDGLRAIGRLADASLRKRFLQPATAVLDDPSSSKELAQAALFALGRVPDSDDRIFTLLSERLESPALAAEAAEALLHRGPATWLADRTAAVLIKNLPSLEKTEIEMRAAPGFRKTSELLMSIARTLGSEDELRRIEVLQLQPARIATVPDHLKFDLETFEVKAGAPIELHFDNPDAIAHNIVISSPGSMEKVGTAVDALLADPKAMERDWIPDMPEVLFHTPMAQAETEVTLRFRAPSEPGRYPFICTVPGHWRVMKGHMVVVP